MYIMCVILCLFSALSRRVGALQIPIIIIVNKPIHSSVSANDDNVHFQVLIACWLYKKHNATWFVWLAVTHRLFDQCLFDLSNSHIVQIYPFLSLRFWSEVGLELGVNIKLLSLIFGSFRSKVCVWLCGWVRGWMCACVGVWVWFRAGEHACVRACVRACVCEIVAW